MLKLLADLALSARPGSFGARLDGQVLYVPNEVRFVSRLSGWLTAEELYRAARETPALVADALGWTPDQCAQAASELRDLLRGTVPEDVLDPPSRPAS